MTDEERLVWMVQEHEAEPGRPRLKLYRCPKGKLTIGYGRNVEDNPLTREECKLLGLPTNLPKQYFLLKNRGITEDQAEMLFRRDLDGAREMACLYPWFLSLDPVRQAVIIDMLFNLGSIHFAGFVVTRKALSSGDWAETARRMRQSKWYDQTKMRARRLCLMMRTGLWIRREGTPTKGHWRMWH